MKLHKCFLLEARNIIINVILWSNIHNIKSSALRFLARSPSCRLSNIFLRFIYKRFISLFLHYLRLIGMSYMSEWSWLRWWLSAIHLTRLRSVSKCFILHFHSLYFNLKHLILFFKYLVFPFSFIGLLNALI